MSECVCVGCWFGFAHLHARTHGRSRLHLCMCRYAVGDAGVHRHAVGDAEVYKHAGGWACVCVCARARAHACAGGLVALAGTLARTLAGMHSRACVDMPSAMPVCTDMPSAMPTCCRHSQSAGAASARGSMPKCAPFNTVASWTDVFAVVIPLTTPKSHSDNSPIRRH